jgi:hypothetical protein
MNHAVTFSLVSAAKTLYPPVKIQCLNSDISHFARIFYTNPDISHAASYVCFFLINTQF